ncbi:hypothetical protein AWZ03_004175 [Drosophila navojoa]|uniref:TIL domain-containing protein n=1 Tax=Drosophila navojoa TaxID=7232 RepID=A0A484BKJ1_DRONA|nr:hypothetical protein AWZ03_004175 [Drosophila navojoa]
MWKWLISVNLLLLVWRASWAQRAVTCLDPVYMDCQSFCQVNCVDDRTECLYNCDNGCGCTEAYVVRNNGGCRKISKCVFIELTSEEVDTAPPPCVENTTPAEEGNDDDRLNLLPFVPFNRFE